MNDNQKSGTSLSKHQIAMISMIAQSIADFEREDRSRRARRGWIKRRQREKLPGGDL